MHMRCYSSLLLWVILVFSLGASAQTAQLSGLIKDSSGAVVPGASVLIQNQQTGIKHQAESNQAGSYAFPFLKPGLYEITVEASGFQLVNQPGITLTVGQQARIDFVLQVGAVAQTITVEGGAPLLNTESPAVSTIITREFVQNLPLNGRSFSTLIELTPGVVLTGGDVRTGQFSVNGQRSTSNAFIIDGVSANVGISALSTLGPSGGSMPAYSAQGGTNNLVSIDALEEFRIQTSTFSAEFGRQPGAQVSVVTRSGTNQFHGTLFNYFRNDKLDGNDWFANSRGGEKAALRQNDFGGVIGGPIVKDRTFFFFSYEGLRLRQPQFAITFVPTEASRQLAPPETKPLLDAFPLPNGPDLPDVFPPFTSMLAEFSSSFSVPSTLDAYSLKLDQSWGKLRLFGRYNHAPSTFDSRFAPYVESLGRFKTQTLTAGATWAFTPNVINEFRGNWSRSVGASSRRLLEMGGNVIPPDSALFPSFTSSQEGQMSISILTFGAPIFLIQLGVGKNTDNRQRQFNFIDTLSVVKGSHQLKFGVDYQRLSPVLSIVPWNGAGTFFGVPGVISGTALASVSAQETELTFVFNNLSLYAQDTWKATPRLTLTYGLRWEYVPPPSEKNGRLPFTVLGVDDPATMTLAPQGTPLWKATRDNFAPRAGAAYHLSQKWGLVLRGGGGLFYDLGNGPALAGASIWPYRRSKSLGFVPWPIDDAAAQPPAFSVDPPFDILVVADSNLKLPYSVQWNLALEKSLGPNQTVSATYVGQTSRRLLRQESLLNLSTINPDFINVTVTRNEATSSYHAGQFQFQRRLSRGLQALVNYTWSHAIDEVSEESFIKLPDEFLTQVGQLERGSADFDVRHNFTAAVTYNIPSPANGGVGKAVLGNWSIDSIVRARTGTPMTVFAGSAFIDGQFFSNRADQVPGEPFWIKDPSVPAGKRLNPAAFSAPPADRIGNMGRNSVRGLSISQVDFALRRRFTLTERASLQFRTDFFNIFNHPNFAFVNNVVGGSTFGQASRMLGRSLGGGGTSGGLNPLFQIGGPRSIQFALKIIF